MVNTDGLVAIIPLVLKTLLDAIVEFDKKLDEILKGFATTYGQLHKLEAILKSGLQSQKSRRNKILRILGIVAIVIGCNWCRSRNCNRYCNNRCSCY